MDNQQDSLLETLARDYEFELVPDTPAATAAGWTLTDRQNAQVLYGPVYDEENFYYCAYAGTLLFGLSLKSSILMARRKVDGTLVYAINCQDYTLDIGPTARGPPVIPPPTPLVPSTTICRGRPIIDRERIYLTSGSVTNIGPQLFCINKNNGTLIYAIAYYLPENVEIALGVKQITTRGDYSTVNGQNNLGSNARVSTFNPILVRHKGRKLIYLGASSLQNIATFNPGLVTNGIYTTNYPFFTDQGFLHCVEEIGNIPKLIHRTPACAPTLHAGDILTTSPLGTPGAEKNPFFPGENSVLITTTTTTIITSPGQYQGLYSFAQKVLISIGTIISPALFAPFWNTLGPVIQLNTDPTLRTLADTLPLLVVSPNFYTITTKVPSVVGIIGTSTNTSQQPLWYIKEYLAGQIIANNEDANGLGYWGNDTWGAEPFHDLDKNVIYFGTGQSHNIPFSEREYYNEPVRRYGTLKTPFIDATNVYINNSTADNLNTVNLLRLKFEQDMRDLSLANVRSPRGQMSYPDAIIGASPESGRMLYGVRSVPSDTFTFLGTVDPLLVLFPTFQVVDGDMDAGTFVFTKHRYLEGECKCKKKDKCGCDCKRVETCDEKYQEKCAPRNVVTGSSKQGGSPIIIADGLNRKLWTHNNLADVGIVIGEYVYIGPNGLLGGSNYQSTSTEKNPGIHDSQRTRTKKNLMLGNIANSGTGSTGTGNVPEQFITRDGVYIPRTNSYSFGFNPVKGYVEWNYKLQGLAYGMSTFAGSLFFTGDNTVGRLYGIDLDGNLQWTYDARATEKPMLGGVASPSYDEKTGQMFWIASYDAPGVNQNAGRWGLVLKVNSKLALKCNGDFRFLDGKTYTFTNYAAVDPIVITNRWTVCAEEAILSVTQQPGNYFATYKVFFCQNTADFEIVSETGTALYRYNKARFLNKATYILNYETFTPTQNFEVFLQYRRDVV